MAETNKNVVTKSLGVLGSIDANTGSSDLGWDTDHFPMDIRSMHGSNTPSCPTGFRFNWRSIE